MTHRKSAVLAALLVGLVAVPAAAQGPLSGAWELNVQAPQGTTIIIMNVTVDGAKASGTLTSAMGTTAVTGTATADSLEMNGTLDMQGISIPLGMTGTLAGGAFNGAIKLGDFGDAPFTGKRPGPNVAAPAPAAVAGTGVTGKWNVTLILTGVGELPVVATLTQTGPDVTGTLGSVMGDVPLKGSFVGSTLKLEFTITAPTGPLTVNLTGELAGQSLAGKASIAGMGEADWKAVRGQ